MKVRHHKRIREDLRAYDDGMTCKQLSATLGIAERQVRQSLDSMPDVYIDRWDGPFQGSYAGVWCAVHVPENCPHPKGKKS